ncbi:MAG: ATP-binding cassette domain-containing protein [Butyrivibrio sp.]|nr:ATP-binding cassette domain-containing protein [Butyrivibrio sp.]
MIVFDNVTKKYEIDNDVLTVYKGFSETIEDGEFVVVTGKSGSGKTTLLQMLLKETEPQDGEILVDGKRLSVMTKGQIPFYRRSIGVVFQDSKLIHDMTVYDNLYVSIIATGGAGREAAKKIANVLTMLGIDHLHKRLPMQLSGGEQQKVCLARAIINNPKILLVDEPTGNLDPVSSKEINRLLQVFNNQGITVLMATHDLRSAVNKGRRILDLDSINETKCKGA